MEDLPVDMIGGTCHTKHNVYRLCSQQVAEILIDSINPECFFVSYVGNKSMDMDRMCVTTAMRMQIDRFALACMVI